MMLNLLKLNEIIMSIRIILGLFSLYFVISLFSCRPITSERPLESEFEKDATGVLYYFHNKGDDSLKTPAAGDYVKALIDWGKRDSIVVTSKMAGGPVEFQIKPMGNNANIFSAMKIMRKGDSATFILSAKDYFFPNQIPDFLKENDRLYFDIRLLDILSQTDYMRAKHSELMKLRDEEQVLLKRYLHEQKIENQPLNSGLYFLPIQEGKGDKVLKGMMLTINYEYSLLNGKKLYSTWDTKKPLEFRFGSRFDTPGMNEALSMMREGGRAKLIVPSKIGYGEQGRAQFIPPYSTLIYDVEVIEVVTEEEFKNDKGLQAREKQQQYIKQIQQRQSNEPGNIKTYISHNYPGTKPNSNGIYFLELHQNEGTPPVSGDSVMVHYRQYLLDGTKLIDTYQSNTPFKFVAGRGEVILGWDIAIKNMTEGSKAKILLPSNLAYHDRGAGKFIHPYTPLIYDIEVLKVIPRGVQPNTKKR